MRRPVLIAIAALSAVAAGTGRASAGRCSLASEAEPCPAAGHRTDLVDRPDHAEPGSPWIDRGAEPAVFAAAPRRRRDHRWEALAGLAGVYAGFSTWAYFAWYHDQPNLPEFTIGGDGYFGQDTYAGGADKLGHAWANMVLGRAGTRILRWGGWDRTTASVIGNGLAWSLFLGVEIKDGFYYQLSPGDMYANTAGALLSALMIAVPSIDDLIDFRVHYYPSDEYLGLLRGEYHGDPQLNSLNIAEDYSGQTYFLAVHLRAVGRLPHTPPVVDAILDHVDIGIGFNASKYKPDAPEGSIRRQRVFLAMTVDLQDLVGSLRHRKSRAARVTGHVGHAVLEVFGPPFVLLPAGELQRSPDE